MRTYSCILRYVNLPGYLRSSGLCIDDTLLDLVLPALRLQVQLIRQLFFVRSFYLPTP